MPRVRLRLRGSDELHLLALPAEASWESALAKARAKLALPPDAPLALRVGGALVSAVEDLESDDLVEAELLQPQPSAAKPSVAAQPTAASAPRAEESASDAASKKAAKRARQRDAKRAAATAAAPEASPAPLVALDAANLGHAASNGAFAWSRVAAAVAHYAERGVRAVPVTKRGTLMSNPVPAGMRVRTVAGEASLVALVEANLVEHDDFNPEADDAAVVAFARLHECAWVSNDGYASALRAADAELRRWMEQRRNELHSRFAFLDDRFVPLKPHPSEAYRREVVPAKIPAAPAAPKLTTPVDISYRVFTPANGADALAPPRTLTLQRDMIEGDTVAALETALLNAATDGSGGTGMRVFVYSSDGTPFEDPTAFLTVALAGAGMPDEPEETLLLLMLPNDACPRSGETRDWTVQTCNFAARNYGVGQPAQEPSAMARFCAAMCVAANAYRGDEQKNFSLLVGAADAGLWPPALLALHTLVMRQPKKALTPHASAALLAGMIAAAGALAHLPVPPPRRLAGYTPTLLAHFLARGASLDELPVVSVRLRTEAGERLRVAAKLRGSGDALFELASHYGTKAYEDCDTWYVTRLIARSVGGAPDADAWMLSNEAEEAALCRTRIAPLTAEAARAAEAAEAATPLRMTPPLDLKPLATGAYLTRDMSGEACAFVGKPKSEAGHEAILWLPLAAEERIVNLLALAKALAEDAPAAAARSAVTEAVMVVLDVSASMLGVAFHPPPPAADAGNSRVVFLTGFGSVLAQCTAQGGPPAAIEARLTARLTALCDALTGISPVRVGPHRHPETGAPRASAHLNFASPAAAEVAVLGLDGAPTGGGRSERLRAELAHDREADGGRRSGPRSGAAAAEGRDRLSLMKAALAAFAEHSIALDLPHAGGLLLCGSTVSPACALTPSLSLFWERSARAVAAVGGDARGGATRLYDALSRAAADLKTFAQQHPGCACRVLVLSDGEDTSRDSPSPALAALADARVTLDAVLLGSRAGVVAAMAEHTGGITVRADSEAAMLSAFQREAFLSLRARAADAQYATRGPADEASLKRLAQELNRRADAAALRGAGLGLRRIGGDAPEDDAAAANVRPGGLALALHGDALAPQRLTAALAARVHAAAEDAPTRAARAPAGGRREARLVEELRRIQRTGFHADVDVFVSDDDIATWHLVLHAPPGKGLLYDGGSWRLLIDFPAGYPSAPPIVYFVTPILHVNVSRDGRCCHALLDRDYSSDAPLNQMLPALLAGLLAQPEPGDPLNCELAELYYADARANAGAPRGEPVSARYELAVRRAVALHAAAPPEQLRAALRDAGAAQRVPAAPPSTPPVPAGGRGRRRR